MRGKKVSGQVGVSTNPRVWNSFFLSFASLKPQGSSASPATYVQPRLTRVSPPQGVTLDHAAAPPQTEAWGRGARRDHLLRG